MENDNKKGNKTISKEKLNEFATKRKDELIAFKIPEGATITEALALTTENNVRMEEWLKWYNFILEQ